MTRREVGMHLLELGKEINAMAKAYDDEINSVSVHIDEHGSVKVLCQKFDGASVTQKISACLFENGDMKLDWEHFKAEAWDGDAV